jgi:probable rRNA maturation factor
MRGDLCLRNRQHARPIRASFARMMIRRLLEDLLNVREYDMAVHFVGDAEMTRLNESRLRHAGTTDVISFDYSERGRGPLAGEVFVCVDEAVRQSARYRVTWRQEMARYIIHGILHIQGFDDRTAASRRKMKREENRLLRALEQCFDLRKPDSKSTLAR